MKIGELAKAAGCTAETIRFYEKIGLFAQAQRTASNYRLYGKTHLERLIFIRNCRALEMSHDEIRTLITIMDHPAKQTQHHNAHVLLNSHLHHIDERIAELTALRMQLLKLQQDCHPCHDSCGILQGLAEMEVDVKAGKSHL
ncbi:MerR family transcriptional regulator [Orbus hercynius]|uniref:MerR family transcriptional regulator n=1 Tax=Orbus hercynius TaxID=593135 RepID=A0A495RCQ7_9GAMM|nr:Cd(II)/Pb(II)-responsive transcriptional regulator [Orbus hercynius]RKS85070.1 MerR family transcriptional regulator [Orbus hercynius]